MKTSAAAMARSSSQDFSSSSSSSKRHFHWTKKVGSEEDDAGAAEDEHFPNPTTTAPADEDDADEKKKKKTGTTESDDAVPSSSSPALKRKLQAVTVARLRSVLGAAFRGRSGTGLGLGARVVGTLFGHRRGHVHFALQKDPAAQPAFLVELATPISGLVREMTSGLVRIALECNKAEPGKRTTTTSSSSHPPRLLEEPAWRTYCNGKRCGFAARRDCGPWEWKVLKAVEMISMGAGVLPAAAAAAGDDHKPNSSSDDRDGEVMYMRAKFERIVGSRDCEAFYMMNPDSNGAPELSFYLLRV